MMLLISGKGDAKGRRQVSAAASDRSRREAGVIHVASSC
jgi:hypothetical protein